MKSNEVLRKSLGNLGVKSVAADLGLSTSLIYKWCQPSDTEDASGAENPLDRIAKVYRLTGDKGPIEWLCREADGYFVENVQPGDSDAIPLLHMTRRIVREFSDLLDVLTESIENDGVIDLPEAGKIRNEWEKLKSSAESFVNACEQGLYDAAEGDDHE
ncbi:phage regulatory CII family protein [Pontiella sp.]|uniref:phage regulatory CII family protein n=1 Tax=Pontiella sp. TaxID=2837462 RepID=UPI0035672829